MASSPPWSLISLTNSTYHEDYHPLSEVDHFVDELLEQHPDLVTRASIGHSSEGREMYTLTISKARTEAKAKYAKKTGFLLTGAQHAREVRPALSPLTGPCSLFLYVSGLQRRLLCTSRMLSCRIQVSRIHCPPSSTISISMSYSCPIRMAMFTRGRRTVCGTFLHASQRRVHD